MFKRQPLSWARLPSYLRLKDDVVVLLKSDKLVLLIPKSSSFFDTDEYVLCSFDVNNKSVSYWRSVRCFFLWLGESKVNGAKIWSKYTYKSLRRQFIIKAKNWYDVLSPDVVRWANARIENLSNDYTCVDNTRVANKRKSSQVRRYKKQHQNGCCGFFDVEERGPDGQMYLLGFNYGH